jgi:hypothetical protein
MEKTIVVPKFALVVACIVFTLLPAYAQADRKNEIGLLLGATVTPDLTDTAPGGGPLEIGSGITFQLTYARQLIRSRSVGLYFEVPALAIPLQDVTASNGVAPINYDSFFVAPSLRIKLNPSARISPWFSAGGGYALFDESEKRTNGTHNTTRGTSGGALQFGGGIDARTPIKLLFPIGLRAEVRDFYTAKPTYNLDTGGGLQHNIVLSGGLVLHF